MKGFPHLHVHNEFSFLDGYGSAEHYCNKAKENGCRHLALTNHGNVDGVIKFDEACSKSDISPIIGCELYVVKDHLKKEKGEKRYHALALVENSKGWNNLLQIITESNLEGFYYKPRISYDFLLKKTEGLLIGTACSSSFLHDPEADDFTKKLIEKEKLLIEYMPHLTEDQKRTNVLARKIQKKYDLPCIVTNDCHYPKKEDSELQEVLLAIQSKKKWSDPNRWKFDVDTLFLCTEQELKALFERQKVLSSLEVSSGIENTFSIAERCSKFKLSKIPVELPRISVPKGLTEEEFLKTICCLSLQKKIRSKKIEKNKVLEYKRRLKEELKTIISLGFVRYFLIVWDLISWCKKNDILVGPGRGSVGGSLVAYLMEITEVDPIKYNLLFSRFISPARIDLPDIDMDFEDRKRGEVRKYLQRKYGEDNVAGLSTFSSLKGRGALRDVGRVFAIPSSEVDSAAKSIVVRSGGDFRADFTIEDAFDTFEEGIKFKKKYPKVTQFAMALEGQVRGAGQHAAGICISKESLKEGKRCSLVRRAGTVVANWDKYDSERQGIMKLDVLGLSNLTMLSIAKNQIKENRGKEIIFSDISPDDPLIFEQIRKGYTAGAFQIGSPGLTGYCKQLEVSNFKDLVDATSLWRPGTLRAGMTTEFQLRKKGKKWTSLHPRIKDLTKETYGIVLYQEQIMSFMYDLAGLPWKTCDIIRKVISKSQGEELFQAFRDKFVKGCLEKKTLNKETAIKVWNELSTFGSYGFNKSHAVEYSLITYWNMWLKYYYPEEFLCASLTVAGDKEKKEELILEAKRLNLKIKPPTIGESKAKEWTCKEGFLIVPFQEIKGIGEKTAEKILSATTNKNPGFFSDKKAPSIGSKKIQEILDDMKNLNLQSPSEKDFEKSRKYFSFSLIEDLFGKVRNMDSLFRESKRWVYLSNIEFKKSDKENPKLILVKMKDLRFGYRKSVLQGKQKGQGVDTLGTSEALGGAYGFVSDKSDSCMSVFSQDNYSRNKKKVETCNKKVFLTEATNQIDDRAVLTLNHSVFEEDLYSCRLGRFYKEINIKSSKKKAFEKIDKELDKICENCKYSSYRLSVPETGNLRAAIIGGGPVKEDFSKKKLWSGKEGEFLFSELKRRGFNRENFSYLSATECLPKKGKTADYRQISFCAKNILERKIQELKPVIAIAFGSGALYALKGGEAKISELSGKIEWLAEQKFWVIWSLHPSSIFYHPENKKEILSAIELFTRKIKKFNRKREIKK